MKILEQMQQFDITVMRVERAAVMTRRCRRTRLRSSRSGGGGQIPGSRRVRLLVVLSGKRRKGGERGGRRG